MPPAHSQDPADELALRRVIVEGWAALDKGDWDGYAAAFAPDAELEIFGQRRHGREAIAAGPAKDLAVFDTLQHVISNELIDIDGDTASGQWYAMAVHVPDAQRASEHADVGVRYTFAARRESDGWRLSHVAVETLWTAGISVAGHGPAD